jgi:hypothetical protein
MNLAGLQRLLLKAGALFFKRIEAHAGDDLHIVAAVDKEMYIRLGDDEGAKGLSIEDSTGSLVARITSGGAATFGGLITGAAKRQQYVEAEITEPPTQAEMVEAFGAAAAAGAGTVGIVKNTGGTKKIYPCFSDGVSWYYGEAVTAGA